MALPVGAIFVEELGEVPVEVGEPALEAAEREAPADVAIEPALDRLDHASLQAQRRVTIPFVKEVLERSENL